MRLLVLGPLAVSNGAGAIELVSEKDRIFLGELHVHSGQPIGADHLVEALWPSRTPAQPANAVQVRASRLRAQLRAVGAEGMLHTKAGGYLLASAGSDAGEFTALLARARSARAAGDTGAAAGYLRDALGLWRGAAFADVPSTPCVDQTARHFEELRVSAVEELAEAELALGHHHRLAAELSAAVETHPLRERLWSALMIALYRSGRRADAIAAYRRLRTLLVGELGIEPSPELRDLERQILTDAPELGLRPPAPEPESEPGLTSPGPKLLPHAVADFTGRSEEVARLIALAGAASATVATLAIDGMPGIGKTTMAVHVAHALAGRFPDGQLFIDLHGFTPGRSPVEPGAALGTLLRALGVSDEQIPADLDERSALWRHQLAGRRMVIVLDNAAHATQVRPLLPGTPGSMVLVTSRRRLSTLDGAASVFLDVLPPEDAHALFASVAGERVHAEPEATDEVLRLCGYLPLAIRIAAARISRRPQVPIRYLAEHLRDEHRRLSELSVDDRAVAATFNLSHAGLGAEQQRSFQLLGLHPGTDFDIDSAAALTGLPAGEVENLLDGLLDAHLIIQRTAGRYTFHDLLRVYARELATAGGPGYRTALARLLDHYLSTAIAAADTLDLPAPPGIYRAPVIAYPATVTFRTEEEAEGWLRAERANLIAAAEHAAADGWPRFGYDLATSLRRYLDTRAHFGDAIALYQPALRATTDSGDRRGQADILRCLGLAYFRLARYDKALGCARQAVDLHRDAGDRSGEASALDIVGMIHGQRGDLGLALDYLQRGLALHRDVGNRLGEGINLTNLGAINDKMGSYQQAIACYEGALAVSEEIGNRHIASSARTNLGIVYERLGQHDLALSHYRQALVIDRETGNRRAQGVVLVSLGLVYLRLNRHAEAIDHYRQGYELQREIGHRASELHALTGLGDVYQALGDYGQALGHHRQAHALSLELGDRTMRAQALNGIGAAVRASGEPAQALAHHAEALDLARESGDAHTEAQAHEGLGHAHHALGYEAEAGSHWAQALGTYTQLGVPEATSLRTHLAALGWPAPAEAVAAG